ncbi:MAG: hypothetical protein WCT99_08885 [Bacteroidota bacterium]
MNKKNIIFYLIMFAMLFNVGCENPESGKEFPPTSITYSEIYLVNSDGTNLRKMTNGKNLIHYADFIPNSNKIFFIQTGINFNGTNQVNGKQVICTMDLATGTIDTVVEANIYNDVTRVYENREDQPRSIVVSQDGEKLYYAGRIPDMWSERKDIFCVDIQTKQLINLTNTADNWAVGHFRLSFNETKIVYTEFEKGKQTSYLYVMDISGVNKKLLNTSDSTEFHFPQILANNIDVLYVEFSKQQYGLGRLKILNMDSLTVTRVGLFNLSVFFFTELTKENNIILQLYEQNASPSIVNLFSLALIDLNMPSTAKPFFNKLQNELFYFESDWVLKKVRFGGTLTTTTVNFAHSGGSTHVPQTSYTNDKIIFINKNVFTIES